ncbi:flagellar biosynthesis anti-sigma factor FlgM [uncultured Erythrobacter sp.]|uniref:flagellar biosynthesis anti-sigma factor FlgM n=1 Tax=uncultured Erythrobacter sp. TaxID=263913 RepID=UPI002604D364|nr:flagellar biosynthesis anti-sigma factor FlgM [uncultured Erythrobacter sp.]
MPSIELSKLQGVSAPRSLSESDRAALDARAQSRTTSTENASDKPGVSIEVGASVSAGEPPVDADRVAEIRAALQDGSYPLVPTKIADAMIAARVGFGLAQ